MILYIYTIIYVVIIIIVVVMSTIVYYCQDICFAQEGQGPCKRRRSCSSGRAASLSLRVVTEDGLKQVEAAPDQLQVRLDFQIFHNTSWIFVV